MRVELLNPDGLPKPEVYRQVAVASGSRLVFLAGQVARDADGRAVGAGDLAAQTEQAYLNVATALAAVGGSFDDVAKITLYVTDWSNASCPPSAQASPAPQRARRRPHQAGDAAPRCGARRARPADRGGRHRGPAAAVGETSSRKPNPDGVPPATPAGRLRPYA